MDFQDFKEFQAVLPFILHLTYFQTCSFRIRRASYLPALVRRRSSSQVFMLARHETYMSMDSDKLYLPVFYVLATTCRRTRGEHHTKPLSLIYLLSSCLSQLATEAKYILRSRDRSHEWPAIVLISIALYTSITALFRRHLHHHWPWHVWQPQPTLVNERKHPKLIFSGPKSAFTKVCPSPTPFPTSSSIWTAIPRCSPHPSLVQLQYSNRLQTQNVNQSYHPFPRTTITSQGPIAGFNGPEDVCGPAECSRCK